MPEPKASESKKPKTISDDQIARIVSREIDEAKDYSEKRLARRKEAWDRYYGRKLGNEQSGRSKFITRDTMDTIEWMMPFLIRTFASGDSKISLKIRGKPAWVGQALMDKIIEDLQENTPSDFLLLYTAFKDALVSDTAIIKPDYLLDIETVPAEVEVSYENLQKLFNDPDVKIVSVEQTADFPAPVFNVSMKVNKVIEDRGAADNVPYWEFLAVKDARDINDEHPKGQRTKVTVDYLKRINRAKSVDKKNFFKNLSTLEESITTPETPSPSYYADVDTEKGDSHLGYDGEPADSEKYSSRSIKVVEFTEWYTRIDVDGDGFLENIVVWMAEPSKGQDGGSHDQNEYAATLLRWEKNEEGFISLSALKPIIDVYRLYGISWADLVIEVQNLHTMLLRRILDNFDFQNSGRWIVSPEANIDMRTLLDNAPGTAIIGDLDGIKEVTPKGFMSGTFSILDYVKQLKENRTGVRDVNQGIPDPVNQTAQGMQLIYSTAIQRLELIARIFAETGLSDFFKKMGMKCQRYMRRPFITEKFGDIREVTPDMIQGKIVMSVNMGVAANIGMQEAQKVSNIVSFLAGLNDRFPGLLNPERIHNISRKYITSMGFRDVNEFIGDMKGYVEEYQKIVQGQQQAQKQISDLQMQIKNMEMMLKNKEIDSRAASESSKIRAEDVADQRKFLTNKDRIKQQREEALLDSEVESAANRLSAAVQLKAADTNARRQAQ